MTGEHQATEEHSTRRSPLFFGFDDVNWSKGGKGLQCYTTSRHSYFQVLHPWENLPDIFLFEEAIFFGWIFLALLSDPGPNCWRVEIATRFEQKLRSQVDIPLNY